MFTTGTLQSWVADADYTLEAFSKTQTAAACFLTSNPSYVGTDLTAAPANKMVWDILSYMNSGVTFMNGLKIPILAGEKYWLTSGAQQTIFLYLEPVSAVT